MHSEASEPDEHTKTKKSPARGNFSKSGILCDQTFYLETPPHPLTKPKVEVELRKRSPPKVATSAFTSVPREKRGNFRFDIKPALGEFSHHPNHTYGRQKSPTWSFPRKERYGNEKVAEYQICKKHPLARSRDEKEMYSSICSTKEELKSNVNLNKSSSQCETTNYSKNYSIVLPRKTSAVGFFSKSKIKDPFYLTRQQVMNGEEDLERERQQKKIEPCPKGYIQFYKKRGRQPNRNVKKFETYLESYKHEKHFNNHSLTHYPTKPSYHIDFDKHLDRPWRPRDTKGPNFDDLKLNNTRKTTSNIDLNTAKFRGQIMTRYDRAQPEPNTRLDYDAPIPQLGGMVTMDKNLGRKRQLFPIVDPIIKKAGDAEMKAQLAKEIPVKEINEAMRPKCVNKIEV